MVCAITRGRHGRAALKGARKNSLPRNIFERLAMKLAIAAMLLLSAPTAFAGTFNLNLEGKTFTCTEGGSASSGCQCREFPDSNYVTVGLFLAGETNNDRYIWKQTVYNNRSDIISALRSCNEAKKTESLCQ
jgi:hypothetical protein